MLGFFNKEKKEDLDKGLQKSRGTIFNKISRAVAGKSEVDDEVLDEIEGALVSSDISVDTVIKIINRLEERVARDKYINTEDVYRILKEVIIDLLTENNTPDYTDFEVPDTCGMPYVVLIVGVNGAGKTTTIGKLAFQFEMLDKQVLMGAGDTFRAAAIEQLEVWAERAEADIVKQKMGSDPASVAYDTVTAAVKRGMDVVLVDTAGRLHNKKPLMEELSKIKRAMQKVDDVFPHDVLLVLDGSTGQNALLQAKAFSEVTQVTGLIITKLDGTAKGGVIISIADQLKVPIRYIGVGEGMSQLQIFNKKEYVDSLFKMA